MAERLGFIGVQAQHFAYLSLELTCPERCADPAAVPPRVQNTSGSVQTKLDASKPQRLDAAVGNFDAHRQTPEPREELFVDLAESRQDFTRGPGGMRFPRAPYHEGILAHFLGDILLEEWLEHGQRQAQRQRRAQFVDGAPAECPQQPAVQRGKCLLAIQVGGGFTAR